MDRKGRRTVLSGRADGRVGRQPKEVTFGRNRTQADSGENGVLTFVL